eukprot:TRINITY_DN48143_c0_g1_i1.p1 TRINITY_DN48143_c0_g1~~TRINITY_DN48143_c0_g1_i1.p1  ORF type:complete len:554 (-),score=53.86 TRINITY_DN48143_c0_g1_i1:41-1702(-)
MSSLEVGAPASSWGLIIGKGGATLKRLELEHEVKIRVPRYGEQRQVTVSGNDYEHCLACKIAIEAIVDKNSRGKDSRGNKKSSPNGSSRTGNDSNSMLPPRCTICDTEINSAASAYDHLKSIRHLTNLLASAPKLADTLERLMPGVVERIAFAERKRDLAATVAPLEEPPTLSPLTILDIAEKLLADQGIRAFHENIGFKVADLVQVAPKLHETRLAAQKLLDKVSLQPDDPDWLQIEFRQVFRWDDSSPMGMKPLPLFQAPPLEDIIGRCHGDFLAPMIRVPQQLPAALPRVDPKNDRINYLKARHMYPADAGSGRLGIAIMHKLGLSFSDYDFVCGTSFIKGLAGVLNAARDTFYLQRFAGTPESAKKTICVLHSPSGFHGQDDVGHAVERLLCGAQHDSGSYEAATSLTIAGKRFLVTSEVDATSEGGGTWCELKSSAKKRGTQFLEPKVVLQTAINGSRFLVACHLNRDKSHLDEVEWIDMQDEGASKDTGSFIQMGKRARLLLGRIFTQGAQLLEQGVVVKMTYDDTKAPVFEIADDDVQVLPRGMEW